MGVLLTTSVGITKSVFEPSDGGGSFLTHPKKTYHSKDKNRNNKQPAELL